MAESVPAGARLEALREDSRPVRLPLEADKTYVVGRGDDADLRLAAEPNLSRRHFRARLEKGRLQVEKLPGAANPVFYRGEAKEVFLVGLGEQFIVGSTRFSFQSDAAALERPAADERTLKPSEVYGAAPAADRLRLLDLLELPELMRSKSEPEFFLHVASLLRLAARASWARIASEDGRVLGEDSEKELCEAREASRALIERALKEAPSPTWKRWEDESASRDASHRGSHWAVSAAARVPGEPAIVFYVAGEGDGAP